MNNLVNTTYAQIQSLFDAVYMDFGSKPEMADFLAKFAMIDSAFTAVYTELKAVSSELAEKLHKEMQINADAAYYRVLMEKIAKDTNLKDQWTDLLMTMKITDPEIVETLKKAADKANWTLR